MTPKERIAIDRELARTEKVLCKVAALVDGDLHESRGKPGRKPCQREAVRRETLNSAEPDKPLTAKQKRQLLTQVESSPLAWEIRELMKAQAPRVSPLDIRKVSQCTPDGQITRWREIECWCSCATWLLKALNIHAASHNKNSEEWPQTPQQLGIMLNELGPALRLKGVRVTYARHGKMGRLWTLTLIDGDVTLN